MTKEETLEYNKRCAEFRGWEYIDKDLHPQAYENYGWWVKGTYTNNIDARNNSNWKGFDNDLKFHSDWNLIMEVEEAIENLDFVFKTTSSKTISKKWMLHKVVITKNDVDSLFYNKHIVDYSSNHSDNESKKEAVVQAIHKFLIWYNNEKTQNRK